MMKYCEVVYVEIVLFCFLICCRMFNEKVQLKECPTLLLSDRRASVSWTLEYTVLSAGGAVSQMTIRVLSTVKHYQKMRDLKNFMHTRRMSRWNLVMFFNANMFFGHSTYVFYKNLIIFLSAFIFHSQVIH